MGIQDIRFAKAGEYVLRDLDATGTVDIRARLASHVTNRAGQKLILPKGTYKLDLTTDVGIDWTDGTTLEGEGSGSVLQIYGAGTRNLFRCGADTMIFRGFKIEIVDFNLAGNNNGYLNIWSPRSDGNDLIREYVEIDGGMTYDGALNWNIRGDYPVGTDDFTGIEVNHCDWYNMHRAYVRNNADTGTLRRLRWQKNRFRDFYAGFITLNTPSALTTDVLIEGNETKNQFSVTADKFHFGIGSGKDVRVIGNHLSGQGEGIHCEESSEGLIVMGNSVDLTDAAAYGMRFVAAPTGTGYAIIPKNAVVQGNRLKGPGKGVSTAQGVLFVNSVRETGPADGMDMSGFVIEGFDIGIKGDDRMRYANIHDGIVRDCATGLWTATGTPKFIRDRYRNIEIIDCDTDFDHNGATVHWGSGNKAGYAEHLTDERAATLAGITDRYSTFTGAHANASVALSGDDLRLTGGADGGSIVFSNNGAQVSGAKGFKPANAPIEYEWIGSWGFSLLAREDFIGFSDQNAALELAATINSGGTVTAVATDCVGFAFASPEPDPDSLHMVGVKSGVAQNTDTGDVPVLDTLLRLRIRIATNGDAEFWIDDVSQGTITGAVDPSVTLYPTVLHNTRTTTSRYLSMRMESVTQAL